MEPISFLPMIGGIVPLVIAILFAKDKGIREPSRFYFFSAMMCLAVFGIFETLSYMSTVKDTAFLLFIISKVGGFLSPFFILSFASYLKGSSKLPKILAGPSLLFALIGIAFAIDDLHARSWGWSMSVNIAWYVLYAYATILLFSGVLLMLSVTKEMKKVESPRLKNMQWIAYGFAGWALIAVASNIVVTRLQLDVITPMSFLQVLPCMVVACGFLQDKKVDGKAE